MNSNSSPRWKVRTFWIETPTYHHSSSSSGLHMITCPSVWPVCMTLRQVLAENFSHVLDTADLNAFPTTKWKPAISASGAKSPSEVRLKFRASFLRRKQNANIFAIALGFDRLDLIPKGSEKYQSEMHLDNTQTEEKPCNQEFHCCTFESISIL